MEFMASFKNLINKLLGILITMKTLLTNYKGTQTCLFKSVIVMSNDLDQVPN